MGILAAILAYTFLGISAVLDKTILKRRARGSSITFAFWIGVSNAIVIPITLLGFQMPELRIAMLGLGVGLILLLAIRFFFGALSRGEVTQTPTIIGAFTPIVTAMIASILLVAPLNIAEKTAFGILVLGAIVMALSEQGKMSRTLPWIFAASFAYGTANVLQKIVLNNTNFMTGLALFSTGTLIGALALLLRAEWRKEILENTNSAPRERRALYFFSRFIAVTGTLLVVYAIKLEHPALIDAISGMRAVAAFLMTLILLKFKPRALIEHLHGRELIGKIFGTILIITGLFGLGIQKYYQTKPLPPEETLQWGISFSQKAADSLGINWRDAYLSVINDLRPQGIRLGAYWDLIEPERDSWDFEDLDWQVNQAAQADIPIILAIGQKVPRWPECHFPSWLDIDDKETRNSELMEYLRATVERYKDTPNLLYWQVENEPFLLFGQCPPRDAARVDREVALVRELDSKHPILMTDGGEFGKWYQAAKRGDVFGTTMYRKVYSPLLGEFTYPLTPQFFQLKRDVVKFITGNREQKYIVIELGTEPWGEKSITEMTYDEQRELFSTSDLKDNLQYARETSFDTYYLWGAEWWYWMKESANDPSYWDVIKDTMQNK